MSDTSAKQGNEQHNVSGAEAQKKITELVKGIKVCMMNTAGTDGTIESRPMAVQNTEFDGTFWFLTYRSSEKVDEVETDRHVTLTFAQPSDQKYLTLKGKASVSQDRGKIHELWNDMYKAWFPGGEEDPNISVLRVEVSEGDYWDAPGSKLIFFAKYALASATGGKVPVGESGHVTV